MICRIEAFLGSILICLFGVAAVLSPITAPTAVAQEPSGADKTPRPGASMAEHEKLLRRLRAKNERLQAQLREEIRALEARMGQAKPVVGDAKPTIPEPGTFPPFPPSPNWPQTGGDVQHRIGEVERKLDLLIRELGDMRREANANRNQDTVRVAANREPAPPIQKSWTEWGVLRTSTITTREGQPMWFLEKMDGGKAQILHVTTQPGTSFNGLVGQSMTVYGTLVVHNDENIRMQYIIAEQIKTNGPRHPGDDGKSAIPPAKGLPPVGPLPMLPAAGPSP